MEKENQDVKVEVVEEKKKKDKSDFWWWAFLGGTAALWIFSKGSRYGYKRGVSDCQKGLDILCESNPGFKENVIDAYLNAEKKLMMK